MVGWSRWRVHDPFLKILKEVTEVRNEASTAVDVANKQLIIDAEGVVRELR